MTRPLRTRRLLAAIAVAPLLSTALVACGGDSESDEAKDPATSSSATADAEPADEGDDAADASDLEDGQDVPAAQFVDIISAGVEASTTARTTTTSSFGGQTSTSEGVVDYTTTPPSISMTTTIPGGGPTTEVIAVDGITYVSLGELSQGKYWKIDPADPDGPMAGMGMDQLLKQNDPLAAIQTMEEGIDKVTYVGEEDVDGRDLDHFEMTVDLAASLASLGTEMPKEATQSLPKTITYDVWLDEEGRIGKMVMEMPVMGSTTTMEMTMDDWGTDVTIEAPPAAEVTDMPDPSEMMQEMQPSPAA
ncbi:LppX_LprAFG lipoprotein [Nocardioides marmotae]|uniref:LppX_LprAFG lipoprotein n=1 Tax=Nocardioides marmotae TaxID=2663857 RepID=UPI0012B66F3D|nr:LppX_LprAFG lipoprotein [Nocardioides marmotae]MBC9733429.1 LppX_LprAFG lipoprotein [Nocardioides marmotae]MTB84536.1 LppX_LprAFG lipoprotein [Nocardioides marmotae]